MQVRAACIDVALAEFNALRAEIVGSRTTQSALVGVALTAIGLLFTLGLPNPGEERLLLAVPPPALIVSVLHPSESFRIHRLGDYIREDLWEYLKKQTGYPHSWETRHFERTWNAGTILSAVVFDGAVTFLFVPASVSALWYADVHHEREGMAAGWPPF